ncbi:MAG: aminodeoxychorismate synthase component I [Anaerolineales bacterium]
MIQVDEVLLKRGGAWLHFFKPHQIISASQVSEVRAALREAEALVNERGWYAAGFVSYNAAPAFDSALRAIPSDDFPLLWFGLYDAPRELENVEAEEILPALNWQPEVSREAYCSAIDAAREYIAQGKTYQVNFTTRLRARFDSSAWNLFARIARAQNRYAAYVDTGRYAICSASPELFFTLDGEKIFSRPMKGTMQRGRTTREDAQQAERLRRSEKNRAENVMIVDMIRNDFGRIAETGSVHVPALFEIEKYPTLLQMTSTVQAQTRRSVLEIFDALFPCASITGAPKVSTMNIIAELESSPRNIYTGSIGFIAPNRKAQFNVAIRTALIDREAKTAEYGAGGGVVWDSTREGEYDEAILKARVLTSTPQFDLLETLRWNLNEGYFLLEEHLARLEHSAAYFDFPFSRKNVEEYLQAAAKKFDAPRRVRLTLNPQGGLRHQVFSAPQPRAALRAHLAEQPVDSTNPFLFHKTTRREIYPTPKDGYDDALLYNERGALTEFTTGNLVMKIDGELFTPPVECGLLAGTFRARLLSENKIAERVLFKDDFARCEKIFFINSVRGFEEVVIK